MADYVGGTPERVCVQVGISRGGVRLRVTQETADARKTEVCSRRLTWRLCGLGQLVLDLAFRLPRAPENRTRFRAPKESRLPIKLKSPLT
jgi:hypothetical protein